MVRAAKSDKVEYRNVIRAYFNGYGMMGRRERWYDPNNKTMWVSLEGRMAVAVKNWRYAIRNAVDIEHWQKRLERWFSWQKLSLSQKMLELRGPVAAEVSSPSLSYLGAR